MTQLLQTTRLRSKVNPDVAKSAGPLLHGWARRTSRGMVATPRHVRALADYLPVASADVYTSLGGADALDWAHQAIAGLGSEEAVPVVGPDEILVLGLPYGGPKGGKDSDGQYFSPMTDFMDGVNDTPPVMYTHGTQNGFEPEPVGMVTGRWYDRRGGWFKVKLDRHNPRYDQLKSAHSGGYLRASSGVVPASYSFNAGTGHIDTWLVGELSLVDTRDGYRPVNGYAITKAAAEPVLFDDYYGDAVTLDEEKSLWDSLMSILNRLRKIEAADDGLVDNGSVQIENGIVQPVYKAEEKCSPEVNDADMDISYLKAADFGGKKRSALDDSDFALPSERKFPVVDQEDLNSAVRLIGQYKGNASRATIEAGIRRLAKKHNLTLPDSWTKAVEENQLDLESTEEKCLPCEEAKRLGDQLKAELATPAVEKCARCPEAIGWIRGMVKAAKVSPAEAFTLIDRFTSDDAGFDELRNEVEGRTSLGISKARQADLLPNLSIVNPNSGIDPQSTIDPEHMAKQRRLAGLPAKK